MNAPINRSRTAAIDARAMWRRASQVAHYLHLADGYGPVHLTDDERAYYAERVPAWRAELEDLRERLDRRDTK